MKASRKEVGLRYWMARVLQECEHVAADFSADPVHDLRVALRRCRSVADGMIAMDPDPEWKAMKKSGKRLFQRLGALRDVQIMMEWIEKLHPAPALPEPSTAGGSASADPQTGLADNGVHEAADPAVSGRDATATALLEILKAREAEHKQEARAALEAFDRKEWKRWSKTLPQRATRVRPGSGVFKHLALERWTAARELHVRAMRNRSQVALHTLRIGIKRFRYIVENFLPEEHAAWSSELKHMQDLLGEVHDFDVLWGTALACRAFPDAAARTRWHSGILEERRKRVEEYREKTAGAKSLWTKWRSGLPQGEQVKDLATRRMKLWARALDPDFAHSGRVARLALQLYDGLSRTGLLALPDHSGRGSLYLAALLHDVGKSKGEKGHHKESLELIEKHGTPLGWSDRDLHHAAIIARFHAGALPARGHRNLRDLLPEEQKQIIWLAAILRLANAFDSGHDGLVRHLKIENAAALAPKRRADGFRTKPARLGKNEALVIEAEGYVPASAAAQTIAAERYLLETALRRPVIVKAADVRRIVPAVRMAS